VEANLGPPQFGIPIAALLIGTWARSDRGFRVGLGLFLIPSAYHNISGAVEGQALHQIPILLGGPGTVLMLSIWKHQRGRALEMLTASAGAAYLSANGSASS
jgi:hypothetical protein